jgi:Ti-type conjugative transfer relaxase TraA
MLAQKPMAIAHFHAQLIGASTRSVVAAAAYRHRTTMVAANDRTYAYKPDPALIYSAVVLPTDAPRWITSMLADKTPAEASCILWNAATVAEKRYDAQIAREFVIALPIELTAEQNIQLMKDYASEFTRRGFAVDWVYHDKPGNPHVHLMHTMRPLVRNGFGNKAIAIVGDDGKPTRKSDGTIAYTRFDGGRQGFAELRDSWYELANIALARAGHDVQISGKSYAERGINMLPSRHLGPALAALKARGVASEALQEFLNDDVARNEMVRENPTIVIDIVANERSIFSDADIEKALRTLTNDDETFDYVRKSARADPRLIKRETVNAEASNTSETPKLINVYTTTTQIETETNMLDSVAALANDGIEAVPKHLVENAIAAIEAGLNGGKGGTLTPEQTSGVTYLTTADRVAVLTGLAGTGKSTLFLAANNAWKANGTRVYGTALSSVAARGLEASSGIPSRTVASLTSAWEKGRGNLKRGDVLVIDEAGMIGSAQMTLLIQHATKAGAKIVLAGDTEQLQPIGAGAPMRAVIESVGHHELTIINRQRDKEQAAATTYFARGRVADGLAVYRTNGGLHVVETTDQAIDTMVKTYVDTYKVGPSQLALAYTNKSVDQLNLNIRTALRDLGKLGAEHNYATPTGPVAFADADRIILGETKTITLPDGRRVKLDRGALGTVTNAAENCLVLALDNGTTVTLDPKLYPDIAHGYAVTIHKSQGVTVDRAFVLASKAMDRHMAYVAFSRHRDNLAIFASQQDFGDVPIDVALSRSGHIANALDGVKRYFERRGVVEHISIAERLRETLRDSRARLDAAWSQLEAKTLDVFLRGRSLQMPGAEAVSAALRDGGFAQRQITVIAPLLQLLVAHGMSPADITRYILPEATTVKIKDVVTALAAVATKLYRGEQTGWANANQKLASAKPPVYKTGPDLVPATGRPTPPPPPVHMHINTRVPHQLSVKFDANDTANAIIKAAGYTWDRNTKAWTRDIAASERTTELDKLFAARLKMQPILEAQYQSRRLVETQVKELRLAIPNLAITSRATIYVGVPAHQPAREALAKLGGRAVYTASTDPATPGAKTLSFYAFPPQQNLMALRADLSRISNSIPDAPAAPAEKMLGTKGIGLTMKGSVVIVDTARLPRTLDILAPAQPRSLKNGNYAIRLDVVDFATAKTALENLAAYHDRILIPPYKPGTGVDLSETDISTILARVPYNTDKLKLAAAMIEDHYGSLDSVTLTAGADPIATARLKTVAAHVSGLQTHEKVQATADYDFER